MIELSYQKPAVIVKLPAVKVVKMNDMARTAQKRRMKKLNDDE